MVERPASPSSELHLVFVCLGNICRSPTAEGVMRHMVRGTPLASRLHLDSAGTGGWHAGELADPRTRAAAAQRGIDLTHRARQFVAADFARFDYILAMDRSNHRNIVALAPDNNLEKKVHLFRSFDPTAEAFAEVPDPYYGGPDGFEEVLDICEAACQGLLDYLREAHGFEK